MIVGPDDDFGPEDEGYARDYIVRRPIIVGPAPIVGSIPLRPGTIVPGDVELTPFTDAPNPSLRRYGYFIAPGDKVVVVNPADPRRGPHPRSLERERSGKPLFLTPNRWPHRRKMLEESAAETKA